MNKNIWILLIVAIFFGVMFWELARQDIETTVTPYIKLVTFQTTKVEIDGKTIDVEIAKSSSARAKGLSGRPALLENKGMLFVFETPAIYEFSMRDMLFKIDIIWILDDKIVDLTKSAELPSEDKVPTYKPSTKVNYVIEAPHLFIEQNDIRVGGKVKFDLSKI